VVRLFFICYIPHNLKKNDNQLCISLKEIERIHWRAIKRISEFQLLCKTKPLSWVLK